MTPARGKVLVRKVETPETLSGGKILLTQATREELTAYQVEIVSVGDLAYCSDFGECLRVSHVLREDPERSSADTVSADILHPFSAKLGDWVLLAPRSLSDSGEDGLYVVNQDDVLAILNA